MKNLQINSENNLKMNLKNEKDLPLYLNLCLSKDHVVRPSKLVSRLQRKPLIRFQCKSKLPLTLLINIFLIIIS